MRFALLGNHPDGLALAQALVDSGRHQVVSLTMGPTADAIGRESPNTRIQTRALPADRLARLGTPAVVSDAEEILADPAVDVVIVAGAPAVRVAQLRRGLQSERHVLCVHPADEKPDGAYEAAMLQTDVRRQAFPLLPLSLHPAIVRLAEFCRGTLLGELRLLRLDRHDRGEILVNTDPGQRPSVPGWEVLRRLGGELGEVAAFADEELLGPGQPVLLQGRFEKGGLFQVSLVPLQPETWCRLALVGEKGMVELTFPQGWEGPSFLTWRGADGESNEEAWPAWDPWPPLIEAFENALAGTPGGPTWQDEVRSLELDEAAFGSVKRRRAEKLDYQEASEEVGFKGTMALAGCGLLWVVILLLIASRWLPWVGWVILPMLLVFIAMQFLRYALPARDQRPPE